MRLAVDVQHVLSTKTRSVHQLQCRFPIFGRAQVEEKGQYESKYWERSAEMFQLKAHTSVPIG
jgi:hypothetical protein